MATYLIFPIKDNFISSIKPTQNYGRDEILDISSDTTNSSRAIIQFDSEEINSVINNISGSYKTNLKLYLANASELPQDYNIEIHALSQSWDMGTGRFEDNPNPQNGSCWNSSNTSSSLWNGGSYIDFGISQSFGYQDNKDISCDVTSIINNWNNNLVDNNGFILKYSNTDESSLSISTRYFSSDTHTIYPPCLEFYWNDTLFSSSLGVINNEEFKTTITNNKLLYSENSIHKFIIKNRDIYPIRQFQTSSVYLNNKILPSESYWALKDVKSKEIIIDYNNIGTKIGADNNGNYFTLYMNGLQPERYYQILIKTIIGNNVVIVDNPNNYFKVSR